MEHHKRTGLVLTALLTMGSVLAIAPTASAHYCEAVNPVSDCGTCITGDHEHWFNIAGVKVLYCLSKNPPPPPEDPCRSFGTTATFDSGGSTVYTTALSRSLEVREIRCPTFDRAYDNGAYVTRLPEATP